MGSSLYQIEKLDDDNFDGWKVQMKSVLIHSELWSYVNETVIKPEETKAVELASYNAKNEKALATILLSVKSSQLIHVKNCESAGEAWKKLQQVHQPSGPARKVTLFKQLVQLHMAEDQAMSKHTNIQ